MAWTLPTALFFGAVFAGLVLMTLAELRWPSVARKGILPLATTRGDRLFITLLAGAFLHIGWLAATDASVLVASAASLVLGAVLMRWG